MESLHDIKDGVTKLLPKEDIDRLFHYLPNGADGNCFFYAVSQSISPIYRNLLHGKPGEAESIRAGLCEFYRIFNREANYDSESLMGKIQTSLYGVGERHTNDMCRDKTYAEETDVLATALYLDIEIMVFSHSPGDQNHYFISTYYSPRQKIRPTVLLRLSGEHYEAMIPKLDSTSAYYGTRKSRIPSPSKEMRPPSPKGSLHGTRKTRTPSPKGSFYGTRKARTPSPTDPLLGRTIRKMFRSETTGKKEPFIGTILEYDPKKKLYRVYYPDEDEEQLTKKEIEKFLI
uniref:OTU domain-containing protein n=1 Tax=viral metagenome TaxID=1070528 RepID=A0A6C0EKS8_9ZZZZ